MTTGLIAVLVTLGLATLFGLVWQRRTGRLKEQDVRGEWDFELGERATLVQFSSAFCAPCRATKRILAEVAEMVEGVRHVEIDAESRLELVRELNILKTPTVLVLDASGRIVQRAAGQPRKADVIAALGRLPGL
ncbi:thioredoxin family protein [Actinocorallia sp. B10E7]|uniref:TlpA family protein disulfide reductase n=1 Tax=Actinocorallia sp. B10E7 TaxID=3153558 RepID=UPI00325DE82A